MDPKCPLHPTDSLPFDVDHSVVLDIAAEITHGQAPEFQDVQYDVLGVAERLANIDLLVAHVATADPELIVEVIGGGKCRVWWD